MTIDAESKKIEKWADTGDRTDPDDSGLSPALVRATGWPSEFSATDGNVPRRRVFNQLFRELSGVAVDTIQRGILPWDAEVDYLQDAIAVGGSTLYRATVATGPGTSNATNPTTAGQTVWATVTGTSTDPSAPNAPTATRPRAGVLDWSWNCPLDGGAAIDSFDFQWRVSGTQTWSASIEVDTPRYELTGLSSGTTIEARVRATNTNGNSPWSATGSQTPQGSVPEGGSQFALRADPGNSGEVDLSWLEPDNGGLNITSYTVQWRTQNQAFSTGRQASSTDTEHTVGSLTNGTEYFFRVRATNSQGNSSWSNEDSATPAAPEAADPVWNLAGQTTLPADARTLVDLSRPLSLLTDIAPVYDLDADSLNYSRYWRSAKPFAGQAGGTVYALVEQGLSNSAQLYTVNLTTGALTAVGSAVTLPNVSGIGLVKRSRRSQPGQCPTHWIAGPHFRPR